MKKYFSLLLALMLVFVFVLPGCKQQQQQDIKKTELESEEEKTVYAVGAIFGQRLKALDLSETELKILASGMKEAALGQKLAVNLVDYKVKVQDLLQNRMKRTRQKHSKSGEEFIKGFLKDKVAKRTESGLAYKIMKEGTGKSPKATDEVEVHYHGTLTDGTVFDSSRDRKKTATFKLNRVIKGWSEGLQLIKEGGKILLVVPSQLGYGDRGAPPKIPGGATLVFEVELLKVN